MKIESLFIWKIDQNFYSFLGVWDKSGTCVCLDSSLSGDELVYYIEDSDSKYIYTSQNNLSNVKSFGNNWKNLKIVVVDEVEDYGNR